MPTPIHGPRAQEGDAAALTAGLSAIGDPLVDGAARLLSIPLRHVYAALWRVGVLEVRA